MNSPWQHELHFRRRSSPARPIPQLRQLWEAHVQAAAKPTDGVEPQEPGMPSHFVAHTAWVSVRVSAQLYTDHQGLVHIVLRYRSIDIWLWSALFWMLVALWGRFQEMEFWLGGLALAVVYFVGHQWWLGWSLRQWVEAFEPYHEASAENQLRTLQARWAKAPGQCPGCGKALEPHHAHCPECGLLVNLHPSPNPTDMTKHAKRGFRYVYRKKNQPA